MPKIGGISKDIKRCIKWAKENYRQTVWLDDKGYWHASTNLMNTPFYCIDVQDLNGKSLKLELNKLELRYKAL